MTEPIHQGTFTLQSNFIDALASEVIGRPGHLAEPRFNIEITRHFFRLRPRLAIPTLLRRPRYRKILGVKIASETITLYNMKIDAENKQRISPLITDAMVERLAIHLVNKYRMMADVPPIDSLDSFEEFAKDDWRGQARKLLDIAFGSEIPRHQPKRGDDVEAWLQHRRNVWGNLRAHAEAWAIDRLLDHYRECADYGLSLLPEDDGKGDP